MISNKLDDILSSDECESFAIALLVHAVLLLCLSLIFSASKRTELVSVIISSTIEEEKIDEQPSLIIEEIYNFDDEKTSFVPTEIQPEIAESSSLKIDSEDSPAQIFLEPEIQADIIPSNLFSEQISGVSSNIGAGFAQQSSTGGALDRLTVEIIAAAEHKNVTVVWLFDSSVSLNHQRQQIYQRFDKILEELKFASTKTIDHAICSFGQNIKFLTETPTSDIAKLKQNIASIVIDESGTENTFNAVGQVCTKYSKHGSRLLVIVFTDEVGDDLSLLDSVSHFVRSKAASIYVVGSPAPFGKSKTQFKFVEFDPQYESLERWIEIQQGPETLVDMVLDIHSLPIDDETLDSGFGPFALSSLCSDTGGIFFSIHPNRNNHKNQKKNISPLSSYISRFFDHDVMRHYKPDYRSIAIQNKENTTHITKQALIKACSIPLNISGEQTLRFKAFNEGMFAEELGMAQRFSARLEPKINEVYNTLLVGEPAFQSLKDKRWLASYSLAMGRILATKCRIESYNYVLAEAKTGLKKKDSKTNIWTLLPSKEFQSNNSGLRKNYDASQKYLHYVIDNFPNTPWALIANEELNTPIGYSWVEEYQEPPKPNNGGGGNNTPKDDMPKPKLVPKPQRKIDKI